MSAVGASQEARASRAKPRLLICVPLQLFEHAPKLVVAAGDTLFYAGDEGDGCYQVVEGLLKASVTDPDGGERILRILGPGAVVGELSMIDGAPRSASVTALSDSQLRFVSRVAFEAFGRERPELYRDLTAILADRLRHTNDCLAATSFLSMKGRLARAILSLAEAFGDEIDERRVLIRQKVSHTEFAGMANVARENVSRVVHEWTSRALISRSGGYYCIEDRNALEREAER
jgi:CRP/FNR family transcriptional regulator, cyclic AMP receptor protein